MSAAPELPLTPNGRSALDVAVEAAEAAAAEIRRRLPDALGPGSRERLGTRVKGGWNDRVTEVDLAADAAALAVLERAFPDHAVVAEESGVRETASGFRWYVDPLDGTRNFSSGLPHVCVSIGLWADGAPLAGVLIDPVRNDTFAAASGRGATLNGRPVAVSAETGLAESLLGFDMGYKGPEGKLLLSAVGELWPRFQSVRMMGSAALGVAYVGCGRLELYAHHYVQPWDIAAAAVFVREAGGTVTSLAGSTLSPEGGSIAAGAPEIHRLFMAATADSPWRASAP